MGCLCRIARRRQCRHLGNRTRRVESQPSAHDHEINQSGGKRHLRRNLAGGHARLSKRFSINRLPRFSLNWELVIVPFDIYRRVGWFAFRLSYRRDCASHVLLPRRQKRDRETSAPHLRHTDGSHPRLDVAGQRPGQFLLRRIWGVRIHSTFRNPLT